MIWETRAPLKTIPDNHVHQFSRWQKAAMLPLALLLRLWAMSLRLVISRDERALLESKTDPFLFLIWHNRLFVAAEVVRRFRVGRKMYALVSASKDGAWLAAFFAACGQGTVRGSSSRMGREAVKAALDTLRQGHDIGITPDGPRGPMYDFKPGAIIVARRARPRILLIGVDFESSWRLNSWDGFHVPVPFSKVHLRMREAHIEEHEDRDQGAHRLRALLAEINPDRKPAPVRRSA